MIVGAPAWTAIIADRFVSPLLDRYLAATAVEGQQGEPVAPDRPDNLFAPVAGDKGAHGRFGAKARSRSPLLAASRHPAVTTAALAGAAALLLSTTRRKTS